jgi:hypothetical protein
VRFLGQPLGATHYATEFLQTAAATYGTNLQKLRTHLADRHSKFLLFKACAQPSLQHLLTSDIYYHLDPTSPEPLHAWDSPFLTAINTANTHLLAHLGDATHMPPSATLIAHHPVSQGGLGVRDHSRAAKTAFVVSLTRTLQFVNPPHNPAANTADTPQLPPTYARPLATWANPTTDHPLFRLYNTLAPQVLEAHNTIWPDRTPATTPRQLITEVPLQGLASSIYAHQSRTRMTLFHDSEAPPISHPYSPHCSPT